MKIGIGNQLANSNKIIRMKKIYKYYPGNKNSFTALQDKCFWFSKPPYLNDPFDCSMEAFNYCTSSFTDDGKNLILENTKNFGICCFSKNNNNLHLWALYANSHKGFCLAFDQNKIESFCSERYMASCELSNCDYRDTPIDLNQPILMNETHDGRKYSPIKRILSDPKATDELFMKLLLQKNARIWKNEEEMRIILSGRALRKVRKEDSFPSGYKIQFPEDALLEVILGNKTSIIDEEEIEAINSNFYNGALIIKKAKLNHQTWSLKI